MKASPERHRARARVVLLGLGLGALVGALSGCASARAESDPSAPSQLHQAEAPGGSEAQAVDGGPLATPSDPWTERPVGPASPPAASERVRLRLPSSRLEPVAPERRPALPPRARLAFVSAHDAWLVRSASALLALGRELDDPRLEPVVALGPLSTGERQVSLAELAGEADAQGFDLLLVDVRRGDDDRDGLLLHASSGVLLALYEVRGGALPIATGAHGEDLFDRVGQAYARIR